MRVAIALVAIAGIAVAVVLYGVLYGLGGDDAGAPPARTDAAAPSARPSEADPRTPTPRVPDAAPTTPAAAAPSSGATGESTAAPTCAVFGIVRTETGLPVEGATIAIRSLRGFGFAGTGDPEHEVRTGPDGRFRAEGLPRQAGRVYRVEASHRDYYTGVATTRPDRACEVAVGPAGGVRGRVTDQKSGDPIPAARVSLSIDGSFARTTTDADGRYRVARIKPGVVRVAVTVGMRRRADANVPVDVGTENVADFAIPRIEPLHVLVRDATTGQPIRDARAVDRGHRETLATTDASGRLTLSEAPRGPANIVAKGYVPKGVPRRRGTTAERPLLVELERSATVEGVVVAPAGELPEKLRVVALDDGASRPFFPVNDGVGVAVDGSFTLEGVPIGRAQRIHAIAKMRSVGTSEAMTLAAGQTRREVRVSIAPTGRIEGRVVGPDGQPLAGVLVRAQAPASLMPIGSAKTGDDGRYTLEGVPTGSWTVFARKPGFAQGRVERATQAPAAATGVDFRLTTGLRITGVVRDDLGLPLAGLPVHAMSVDPTQGMETGNGRSGEDGRFTIDNLGDGTYRLTCHSRQHRQPSEPVRAAAGATDVVIELGRKSGAIRGVVRDRATGAPVPRFRVRVIREMPSFPRRFHDREGRFELGGVTPGTIGIVATTEEGGVSDVATVELVAGIEPPPVEVFVTAGAVLEGRVLSPAGEPLNRATVLVYRVAAPSGLVGQATTDAAGAFRIDRIVRERIRIEADHDTAVGVGRELLVDDSTGPQELRLLAVGATVRVTVRDGGRPAEKRFVMFARDGRVVGPRGFAVPARSAERYLTDANGVCIRDGLARGHYSISVGGSDGRRADAEIDVVPGSTYDVTLQLK